MNYDVFPGARLAYMHQFPGMYNCVSQVIFYHNELYERRRHNHFHEAIDALPVVTHMYPELPVVLEEDMPPQCKAYWFLISGHVYLMRRGDVPVFDKDIFQLFLARHDDDDENEEGYQTGSLALSIFDSVTDT